MDKEELLRFIQGHQRVNEWAAEERARKLPLLSPAESRRIYEELWSVWAATITQSQPLPVELNDRRLEFMLQRRQMLNRAARA